MTRTLTLYQGADMDPSWDYSDWVEWPDCEFGVRCSNGEATQGELRVRDVLGETGQPFDLPGTLTYRGISAHNVITLTEDASGSEKHIWRGWVIPKDYSRGAQKADRYREIRVSVEDYNTELRGIIVGRDSVESRPAETDVERVLWLLGAYLDGDPRAATVIGDAYVDSGNTITMPAKEYANTSPDEVLRDCATMAGKVYWVVLNDDGTMDLFYDTIDSTNYNSTLEIRQSGDPTEVDGETTFEPIWDVGPASREDGQQLLSGVKLVGPGDISAYVTDADTEDDYNFYEEVIYDDTVVTSAEAAAKAASVLQVRRFEWRTYSCSLLIPADRIHLIRAGMNITIQAKVIPDADDQVVTRRIAQMKFRVYSNQYYKVSLQLDRPIRQPFGKGSKPGPQPADCSGAPTVIRSGESAGKVSSTLIEVTSGDPDDCALYFGVIDDGNAGGVTAEWRPLGNSDSTAQAMTLVTSIHSVGSGHDGWLYIFRLFNPDRSSGAGDCYAVGSAGSGVLTAAAVVSGVNADTPEAHYASNQDAGGSTSSSSLSIPTASGALYLDFAGWLRLNTTVADPVAGGSQTQLQSQSVDDLGGIADMALGLSVGNATPTWSFGSAQYWLAAGVAIGGCAGPVTIGGPGEGSVGEGGSYVPGGTVVEHGDLSGKGGTMHDASQIEYDNSTSGMTADDVQAAIDELDAAITAGGAPTDVNYLVGTASGDLSAEIVVGTTPGGELGGTWASPTVDATHSGSAHHAENHNSRHASGGADAVKLDDLAAPDDNTDLNASTSKHGLLRKLSGTSTEYMDGSGAWSTPAGGGGGSLTVEEVDGSPTDSAVTKVVFPNGTLGITSHVATYTPAGPMINTDADPGTKIYVGLTDPDGSYTLAEGDVWIDRNP